MSPLLPQVIKFEPANDEQKRALLFFKTFLKTHPESVRVMDRQLQYWANDEDTLTFVIEPASISEHDMMHFVCIMARFRAEGFSCEDLRDGTWAYNLMVRYKKINSGVQKEQQKEPIESP